MAKEFTHKQSIKAVMEAIKVNANPHISKEQKATKALEALNVVTNSNSMVLADNADAMIEMEEALTAIGDANGVDAPPADANDDANNDTNTDDIPF